MAISASIVFEVRTGGADTNGGGFKTGATGTDWTLQDAAQYSVTDGVAAGTTTLTSLTANFGTDVVGNLIYVQGGTGSITAGWYEITVRTNSTTITVDRSTGLTAGTGVTLKIGGALATPGLAAALATVAGNLIWVKAGTYTITTSTAGAAGPVLIASAIRVKMEGYSATRGDRAGRPVISAGAVATVTLFSGQGNAGQEFIHLQADGNSQTAVSGFAVTNSRWAAIDCYAVNCDQASANGFNHSSGALLRCKASACTTGFTIVTGMVNLCWADGCTNGFNLAGVASPKNCIATDCSADGFTSIGAGSYPAGCTAEGNGGDGFDSGANTGLGFFACAATNNAGFGFNSSAGSSFLEFCASYNNTSGRTNGAPISDANAIALSGDPWVSAGSDDYRPNNTSGAGAALRAISGAGVAGQTDSRDVSAVQHTETSGGGGQRVIGAG